MTLNFPDSPVDGQVYDRYVWVESRGVWKALENSDYTLANLDDLNISNVADGQGIVYDSATSTWQNSDISVDVYDVETTSTGFFDIPSGTTAERPLSPTNGSIRFNTDLGEPEWYNFADSQWVLFRSTPSFELQYLVIAGGGGGGGSGYNNLDGAGGGAGGYRSSIIGESSGGGASAESTLSIAGDSLQVTIGAGGAGQTGTGRGVSGNNSILGTITSIGGGAGGSNAGAVNGLNGGSGGGGGGVGTTNQGFSGGTPRDYGGGGAGGAAQSSGGGVGGVGLYSNITGSSVGRAGGGGGAYGSASFGGGAGSFGTGNATAGTANTGGGGGGGDYNYPNDYDGASGGSGIVIIKYPSSKSLTIGPGLSSSTTTIGDYKVTQFTAGSDTITFS